MKSEAGQAAPLYITAVTGLLFLALIFFAFGEADVKRSGAQTAADSSALALAKESRSLMELDLKAHITDRAFYISAFNLPFLQGYTICPKAAGFAASNGASLEGCDGPTVKGRWGFHVAVRSNKPVTANLVPGAKGKRARTKATAIVESRCKFVPNPDITSSTIGTVGCDSGLVWVVSPKDVAKMPPMTDLFSVRLVED
ncbi:pilus assembly protein TadG-related protein [Streptomyces sp. NBC_00338]|uniref:pilus assembly protein TadG-related protein n=1 Tax=unclassified Streptomyces TaxID=2593676 RepID=UPI002250FB75|nr:pilus assembly protein TadG-related protein [Streptomyces sp. NBC_00338]MCX5142542.1 pilus assembly protein TadG-related protein [Streptomyces sp. NBC_00338]WSU60997.1 pilus assembly protein TadG-related protein [Streptomyces sp. NBC_01104]